MEQETDFPALIAAKQEEMIAHECQLWRLFTEKTPFHNKKVI